MANLEGAEDLTQDDLRAVKREAHNDDVAQGKNDLVTRAAGALTDVDVGDIEGVEVVLQDGTTIVSTPSGSINMGQ
jgi:hypothetical protein